MKRIGIDARLYFQTGVGVYIRNLLHYLQDIPQDEYEFYVYVQERDADKIKFANKRFIKRRVNYQWHSFTEQIGFLKTLIADKLDLMHFTYFSYPILYRKKFIATVHDTILLQHKTGKASTKNRIIYEIKHVAFRLVFRTQIQKAALLITPTNTIKNQVINFFGKKIENKIKTIYEGINYENIDLNPNNKLEEQFKKKFIFYVGNFYPHKNVESLIKAFTNVNKDIQLVLVGPENYFSHRIMQLIKSLKQEEKIIFYKNASTADLVFFYKHALALVHPSLSEGVGLPLLEALYFNTPIIASNIEVYKEILGNNYIAFNPRDTKDITEKLELFLDKKNTVNYEGLVKKFSFQDMAKETFSLYKYLL